MFLVGLFVWLPNVLKVEEVLAYSEERFSPLSSIAPAHENSPLIARLYKEGDCS